MECNVFKLCKVPFTISICSKGVKREKGKLSATGPTRLFLCWSSCNSWVSLLNIVLQLKQWEWAVLCNKRSHGYFRWFNIKRMSQAVEPGKLVYGIKFSKQYLVNCVVSTNAFSGCPLEFLVIDDAFLIAAPCQQEINLLSQLSHSNIVRYYGSELVWVTFVHERHVFAHDWEGWLESISWHINFYFIQSEHWTLIL